MKDRELQKYSYADCRDYGHAWSSNGAIVVSTKPLSYRRRLICERCGTLRTDRISGVGERRGGYAWPDDYRLQGFDRQDRLKLRLMNLKRETR